MSFHLLIDLTYNVAYIVIKWMYTDQLEGHLGDSLLIEVLSAANKYELQELQERLLFDVIQFFYTCNHWSFRYVR